MEITKENTTDLQGSSEMNSRDDHHWVEQLFPPHFTFQNLLENHDKPCSTLSKPSLKHSTDTDEPQKIRRRQIYLTALQEVQNNERIQKRDALIKRIIRQKESVDRRMDEEATRDHPTEPSPHSSERVDELQRCIWNEEDITDLRSSFAEVERDRCRLREELSCTKEQLQAEREQRKRLQGLVEELEDQLSLSRKKATRQALMINDLKTEGQKMNSQLHKLTIQVKEKEDEADRWRTALRKAKEGMRRTEQERSNLSWELERVQAQWKTEGEKLNKAAQIETEAALLRLQREVEQARDELRAERESHARSFAALDLLRRHFNSQ